MSNHDFLLIFLDKFGKFNWLKRRNIGGILGVSIMLGIIFLAVGVVIVFFGLNLMLGPTPKWCKGTEEGIDALLTGGIGSVIFGAILVVCGLIQIINNYPK